MKEPLLSNLQYSAYIVDKTGIHWLYDSTYDKLSELVRMTPMALENHGNVPNLLVIERDTDFVALMWSEKDESWVLDCSYSY